MSLTDALAGALLTILDSEWRELVEEEDDGFDPLAGHQEWWYPPREMAQHVLADPAFREALTAALAEAMAAVQGEWTEPWNLTDASLAPDIVAHLLPEAHPGEPIMYRTIDVPVIDGVATLPDGRKVASTANVVRVPYLKPEDAQRLADLLPVVVDDEDDLD